eukprot:TRINITY_DN60243_c0_g1_i1.p1 TRINITY_DN60243_c0_g1~~TRINITY_DN60243_c0_g1_i1.p1  ORF type:complete len:251 (-),score=38.64 TRINITY_DN60243_c0_g1_i1:175-927(-)
MKLRSDASLREGSTDEKCCEKLSCCNVGCFGARQRRKSSSEGIKAETTAECCEDSTGMCYGNKDSSQDVIDCGSGYHRKNGGSDGIKGSTKAECCEEDITGMCSGNTDVKENVRCPANMILKSGAASIKGTKESECCEDKIMCAGYTSFGDNVQCGVNQGYKGLICANFDCGTYCSSSTAKSCKTRTKPTHNLPSNMPLASSIPLLTPPGVTQSQWCFVCCEPDDAIETNGAHTQAAVSAVLVAVLSLVH